MGIVPTAVIVRRNDRPHDRAYTEQESVRLPVVVNPHTSPRPVDYTSFAGVGRDPQHAWPHRWLYQSLALADKLSIRSSEIEGRAMVKKIPSAMVVGMGVGRQLPIRERTNIEMPTQTTYGQLAALRADGTTGALTYAKLGG